MPKKHDDSFQELTTRVERLEKQNRQLKGIIGVIIGLFIGTMLIGSSILGIDGILSSPNKYPDTPLPASSPTQFPAEATVQKQYHDGLTLDAILATNEHLYPYRPWTKSVQTATAIAIEESSFLPTATFTPVPSVTPIPTPVSSD